MGRLLNQLSRNEPAAYAAREAGDALVLQARGRLDSSTMYIVEEVGTIARIALWIVLNRPNLAVRRTIRLQQQQLLAYAIGFVLCLLGVVLLALLGSG